MHLQHAARGRRVAALPFGLEVPEIDGDVASYQRDLGAIFDVSNGGRCPRLETA